MKRVRPNAYRQRKIQEYVCKRVGRIERALSELQGDLVELGYELKAIELEREPVRLWPFKRIKRDIRLERYGFEVISEVMEIAGFGEGGAYEGDFGVVRVVHSPRGLGGK